MHPHQPSHRKRKNICKPIDRHWQEETNKDLLLFFVFDAQGTKSSRIKEGIKRSDQERRKEGMKIQATRQTRNRGKGRKDGGSRGPSAWKTDTFTGVHFFSVLIALFSNFIILIHFGCPPPRLPTSLQLPSDSLNRQVKRRKQMEDRYIDFKAKEKCTDRDTGTQHNT